MRPTRFSILSVSFLASLLVTAAMTAQTAQAADVYSKTVSASLDSAHLSTIAVEILGAQKEMIRVLDSVFADSAKFEIDVSSDSQSSVDSYSVPVTSTADGKTQLGGGSGSYQCQLSRFNGVITSIEGLCITEVRLYLPKSANSLVTVSGKVISGSITSIDGLITSLKAATFSSDKEEVLSSFITDAKKRGAGRIATITEIKQIMDIFGTFDAKKVAFTFSGMAIDPQNAEQARSAIFTFDQDAAIAALAK